MSKIKVVKWIARIKNREYHLTENQYYSLLDADDAGKRFLALSGSTINIAFIESIDRVIRYYDEEFTQLPKAETKFVVLEDAPKRLK